MKGKLSIIAAVMAMSANVASAVDLYDNNGNSIGPSVSGITFTGTSNLSQWGISAVSVHSTASYSA